MDKMKIGIPRSIYYYYYGELWNLFFKNLRCEVVVSPKTTREIMNLGMKYANDEMCTSMKNYLGHVAYLADKCDYILVPRIDNYGKENQTCTNFLAIYDIVHNLFKTKLLNYNIDIESNMTERKSMIEMGIKLGRSKDEVTRIYDEAKETSMQIREQKIKKNMAKLRSNKRKILLVGHPYNTHDEYLGKSITKYIESFDTEVIYSDLFYPELTNRMSKALSKELYFKYSKENIGAIEMVKNQVDGVIFITSFPCGPDSLVNELVIRKLKIPYVNLIIDDMDGIAGIETRIESFLDIIERNHTYE